MSGAPGTDLGELGRAAPTMPGAAPGGVPAQPKAMVNGHAPFGPHPQGHSMQQPKAPVGAGGGAVADNQQRAGQ
jgi:hypothetical protein